MDENRVPPDHMDRVKTNLDQYQQLIDNVARQSMENNMESQVNKLKERKMEKVKKQQTTYKKKKATSR